MKRAIRRAQLAALKRRVKGYWSCGLPDDPRVVGTVAAHPQRCSRPGCCGNRRRKGGMAKGKELLTLQERRALIEGDLAP